MSNKYYVYVHKRASSGEPFYYGKGCGTRAWDHFQKGCRSSWWLSVAKKHGVIVEILQSDLSNSDAKLKEIELIASARLAGENIVNISPGGEGFDSELARITAKKQWDSPQHRERMRTVHKELAKLEWRRLQLEKAKSLRNTAENRAKCSILHKRLCETEERKVQLRRAWKAAHTYEAKAKRSETMKRVATGDSFSKFQKLGSVSHNEKLKTDPEYAEMYRSKLRAGWIKRKARSK